METKVNKTMLVVASAVVAAAGIWVPTAQAKGGGGHHSGGGGMKLVPSLPAPPQAARTRVATSESKDILIDGIRITPS